ncbi:hypothetical protein D6833_11795 [Candidatus Parcubacteria bacterium]|nr:MAG: hypothetical protein D6833_11795 [Candidatus Parcubacteria bacterium]
MSDLLRRLYVDLNAAITDAEIARNDLCPDCPAWRVQLVVEALYRLRAGLDQLAGELRRLQEGGEQ